MVGILGLLITLLVPSLARAKFLAKVAKAKVELAGISTALEIYHECSKAYPPARTYCAYGDAAKAPDWAELPPELVKGGYLPAPPADSHLTALAEDPFNPKRTYKYLAPGPGRHNHAGTWIGLWVPDSFQGGGGAAGREYWDPQDCPVAYVLWSVGTFGDIGYWDSLSRHHPLNTADWYSPENDEGLIVRARRQAGEWFASP